MTESESPRNGIAVQEMYLIVLKRFLMKLDHAAATPPLQSPSTASIMLHRQHTFVSALTSVMEEVIAVLCAVLFHIEVWEPHTTFSIPLGMLSPLNEV